VANHLSLLFNTGDYTMNFKINSLPKSNFAHLFALSDEELLEQNIIRKIVQEYPGTPCRISLEDVAIGESVLLLNYMHQTASSPFQSTHAIFVSESATNINLNVNEIPDSIKNRLMSVRAFDANHMIIDAEVLEGYELPEKISAYFSRPEISYLHLHNARMGCFAASVERCH